MTLEQYIKVIDLMISMLHDNIEPPMNLFSMLYEIERKTFKGKGSKCRYETAKTLIHHSHLCTLMVGNKPAWQRLEQVKALMLLQDVKNLLLPH